MRDTSEEMEARMLRMMASRTPAERLRMASSMFESARVLVKAGLRAKYGALTEAQMRGQVFLRVYGDCFSEAQIEKIVSSIPNMQLGLP